MSLDSQPGQGSTFHVYLPLPSLSDPTVSVAEQAQRLCQSPFILYAQAQLGLTSIVIKPGSSQALLDALNTACPAQATGSILIVDDDPRTRHVPVVILSNKLLTLDDVKRLEQHALVTLQSKGILTEAEIAAALNRALFGSDTLPQQTSARVKRAVAYLHQYYARPLARWEIAEAIGVSEDYLSRVFSRELGLSPWDYVNRYRIYPAQELLRRTSGSIRVIPLNTKEGQECKQPQQNGQSAWPIPSWSASCPIAGTMSMA